MSNSVCFDIDEDLTFHPTSMFGSIAWAALTLGLKEDTFYRKRAKLEEHGFPRPDPLNKRRYIKADVEAWVARRRTVPDVTEINVSVDEDESQGVNVDGL
jgi:predicted DNA-binding transcriptional regulator AlpA